MKVKIIVPDSMSDIKLSMYQRFIKETKDVEDETILARKMVSIFCNIEDVVIDSMRAKDYEGIVSHLNNVLSEKPVFIPKVKLNGIEYGFIPKLDDITVGEKADIDTYYKDVQNMAKAMAVLYRPIAKSNRYGYIIEDYTGNEEPLDVPLNIALGANVFFSTLMKDLLSYTQSFIEEEILHNKEVSQILAENGIGINQSILSLEETFSNMKLWVS